LWPESPAWRGALSERLGENWLWGAHCQPRTPHFEACCTGATPLAELEFADAAARPGIVFGVPAEEHTGVAAAG